MEELERETRERLAAEAISGHYRWEVKSRAQLFKALSGTLNNWSARRVINNAFGRYGMLEWADYVSKRDYGCETPAFDAVSFLRLGQPAPTQATREGLPLPWWRRTKRFCEHCFLPVDGRRKWCSPRCSQLGNSELRGGSGKVRARNEVVKRPLAAIAERARECPELQDYVAIDLKCKWCRSRFSAKEGEDRELCPWGCYRRWQKHEELERERREEARRECDKRRRERHENVALEKMALELLKLQSVLQGKINE